MADMTLERPGSVSLEGGAELLEVRDQAAQATETPSDRFSNLPLELQIDILEATIMKNKSRLLKLTRICRRWREFMINTPSFWRHLVLTRKTTQEEVDTWLNRAGGYLSSLRIFDEFSLLKLPDVFRNAAPDMWSRLRSFDSDGLLVVGPEILSQMQVENLRLYLATSPSRESMNLLYNLNATHTRSFRLLVEDRMMLANFPFTALTDLDLDCGSFQTEDFLILMEHNPMIESLTLGSDARNPINPERTVTLANLRRLTLTRSNKAALARSILFPKLEELRLLYVDGDYWLKAAASQRLVRLENVYIDNHNISRRTLIEFLGIIGSIRRLHLDFVFPRSRVGDEDSIIEALGRTVPSKEVPEQAGSLCCPRLQHLWFSDSLKLTGGQLVQLVKARLPRTTLPSDIDPSPATSHQLEDLRLPLITLELRCGSRGIDTDSLTWLRANVPKFTINGD